MMPEMQMIDVKLGDAQMTYIQFIIQEGNHFLFKQVLQTPTGIEDFTSSRDLYANTSLHYMALFDEEDFIITVL